MLYTFLELIKLRKELRKRMLIAKRCWLDISENKKIIKIQLIMWSV